MSRAVLDEDGRCIFTGLLPEQCACPQHRNSPDVAAVDYKALTFDRYMTAMFDSQCAIDKSHKIEAGDRIGHTEDGWACNRCLHAVKQARAAL